MKKSVFLLFLIGIIVLTGRMTHAQDYTDQRVRGKVWKSSVTKLDKLGAHYVVLSFNDDNTFEKRVYYENGTPLGGMIYRGTYSEMPGKLSLTNNRLPLGEVATKFEEESYSNNFTWTNNKEFLFHGVLFSSKFGDYRFFQQEEFGIKPSREDSVITDNGIVHRNSIKEQFKELTSKTWQEQLPLNLDDNNFGAQLISFAEEGILVSTSLYFRKDGQKVTKDSGTLSGTYSEKSGYLITNVENTAGTLISSKKPFSKISKTEFSIGLGKEERRFVICGSEEDVFTKKYTIPYVKGLVENNKPITPILERFSMPFLTVVGKTFVTTVTNPNTGNETLLFTKDGTFVGEFQLPPQNGPKSRIGIYSVDGDKLTVTTTSGGNRKTTTYKLAWINSSEFQLSVGTGKPVNYKVKILF